MQFLGLLAIGVDTQCDAVPFILQRGIGRHAGFTRYLQRNRCGREGAQAIGRHLAPGTCGECIAGTAAELRTQRIQVARRRQHLALLVAQAQVHVQVRLD
ncbi:hypothetical protein D3C81_1321820 [compost metagenome]